MEFNSRNRPLKRFTIAQTAAPITTQKYTALTGVHHLAESHVSLLTIPSD